VRPWWDSTPKQWMRCTEKHAGGAIQFRRDCVASATWSERDQATIITFKREKSAIKVRERLDHIMGVALPGSAERS
jgi:hypothetical protein